MSVGAVQNVEIVMENGHLFAANAVGLSKIKARRRRGKRSYLS
jgi:hypothetical protein